MRVVSLCLVAALGGAGCKDKQAAKQQPATTAGDPAAHGATSGGARPRLEPPKVAGPGVVKITNLAATIYYGDSILELDGVSMGRMRNGIIPKDALERLTRKLEPAGASGNPIGIALEPQLPYLRISELLHNLKNAGFRNLALLTSGSNAVPLELLDSDQFGTTGLRPIVTVKDGKAILWSASGEEGTQQKPKATFPATGSFQPLTSTLSDIVHDRWASGRPRTYDDKVVIVQVARAEKAETLLNVLAAVRGDATLELFPNIYLAGGL